jgi:pyridoxine 4-dehydrogenase
MRAALDSGCNFFNGGTFYGTPEWNSVTLLVEYLKKYPEDADKIVLSIKSGFDYANKRGVGSPEAVKRELDTVLKQLEGVKKVDVFECARVDPDVPIEVTLQFLQDEYVSKGLIGGVALSEVAAATIRRAVKVTKIVLVENEVSLWSTDVLTNGVAATCAELDIPILA